MDIVPKTRILAVLGASLALCAGAETRTWVGGSGALASAAANWQDSQGQAGAPETGDAVVLGAAGRDYPMTWDAGMAGVVPASWTQDGYTNVVTFATVYDPAGFAFAEISGNVVLASGKWTHENNTGSARTYRLYVKCGGGFTIGQDATIDASGLGYRNKIAINGHSDSGTQGGTYGGHGGMATAIETWTYGSLFAPEEPGNAGNAPSGADCSGGGAIRLDIAEAFIHNGAIEANGVAVNYTYYSGAGGSIFINAASIAGTGTLAADAQAVDYGGGGGRIAVVLSGAGADFANYDITNLASCVSLKPATTAGGCGTIYAETAADGANHGWLILKGNGTEPTANALLLADPLGSDLPSANFSKVSIMRKTRLCVHAGQALDLTGTDFDIENPSYGIVLNGGRLCAAQGESVSIGFTVSARTAATIDIDALTLASGATLASDHRIDMTGSLTVGSGAKVTTVTATAIRPTHMVNLVVGGDMTIAEGGSIDVVGKGYSKSYSPAGEIPANQNAGSHGGWGRYHNRSSVVKSSVVPYGSALNPTTHGSSGASGSNTSAGGGVALVSVAGTLTVDGAINADGANCDWYPGAGGSVNITAGALAGAATGAITANSGRTQGSGSYAAGGGGRIAIRLTGAGSDFSAFRGLITAHSRGYSAARCGGAGTIYLQTAAQDEGGGALTVDNGTATTSLPTPIGGDCGGTSFGDITVSGGAIMELANGETLTVAGSFSNAATFNAGAGSTVSFVGSGVASVSGNNAFCNLACSTTGKTISFAAGSTTTVSGDLAIAGGPASDISLVSSEPGTAWNLDASLAHSSVISGAAVRDCASSSRIEVVNGTDLGGNNANVVFASVTPGTIVWTGAGGSAWSDSRNWDLGRVPLVADSVVIPATAISPALAASVKVTDLTIQGGASLDLAANTLEVVGDLVGAGTISSGPSGRLLIAGAGVQTVSVGSANVGTLALLGPGMTLSGAFRGATVSIGNGTTSLDCAFAAGTAVSADLLVVRGDAASPNVTLRPAAPGGTWTLATSRSSVAGALVTGSDASSGAAIVPTACVDGGGNVNWLFNDTRLRWTGANGTDFADGGNWQGGVAPTALDAVVIDGAYVVTLDAPATVAALTVGGGATFTANASLGISGALVGEKGGTLVLNKPVTVGGNFVLLDGATLTHDVNKGAETSKIDVTAVGSGLIAFGAKIDAKGRGYFAVNGVSTYWRGPGIDTKGNVNRAASHGGLGYHQNVQTPRACYGSITNPVAIGSGGGYGGNGGGAVILRFGGVLTLDGEIDADAENSTQSYYSGSGGSVNIRAAALSGSGSAHAGGGASGTSLPGAGGRVAVTLTGSGASLSGFYGTLSAYGSFQSAKIASSAGTVYTKTAADPIGTVTIANRGNLQSSTSFASQDGTDFPKTQDNDPGEVSRVDLVVGRYGTLNLTADATVSSLSTVSTSAIKLNGHRLTVRSRRHAVPGTITPGTNAAGNPGEIVFDNGATLMLVR